MKVRDLIALLESYDGDAEVRLATQPDYPFEYSLAGVTSRAEYRESDEDGTAPEAPAAVSGEVLLLEGYQLGYGERAAWGGR